MSDSSRPPVRFALVAFRLPGGGYVGRREARRAELQAVFDEARRREATHVLLPGWTFVYTHAEYRDGVPHQDTDWLAAATRDFCFIGERLPPRSLAAAVRPVAGEGHQAGPGEHDRTQPAGRLVAVPAGQADVQDHHPGRPVPHRGQGLLGVAGPAGVVAQAGQHEGEAEGDVGVVFDDEDGQTGGRGRHGGLRGMEGYWHPRRSAYPRCVGRPQARPGVGW